MNNSLTSLPKLNYSVPQTFIVNSVRSAGSFAHPAFRAGNTCDTFTGTAFKGSSFPHGSEFDLKPKNNETNAGKVKVELRDSGKNIELPLTKERIGPGAKYRIYAPCIDDGAKPLGHAVIGPNILYKNENVPDELGWYMKNCMELYHIETENNAKGASPYKGLGKELLKLAVLESFTQGFDGRLSIRPIMTEGKSPPCIFYYKNGFRYTDNELNQKMERFFTGNDTLGEEQLSALMYLPKENIQALFRK